MAGGRARLRLIGVAAIAAVVAPVAGAYADTTQRFTYVANSVGYYTSLDEDQPEGMALAGQVRITPRRTSFSIWIDDRTIPNGQTVAVLVHGKPRCLRVRVFEKIGAAVPGKEMIVTVLADGAWLPDPGPGCTGHASAGNAEVRL